MSSHETPFSQAIQNERKEQGLDPTDTDDTGQDRSETITDRPGLSARSTTISGDSVDLESPETQITFQDTEGYLSGEYGHPRPRKFYHARQLGQTPQMQLIKHAITQHLTGGRVQVISEDDDLQGAVADLADVIEDIYDGPHFQDASADDLIAGAISDMVDAAWAYWETLPSSGGEYPVAGFKPLPALQVQHNVDDETGELLDNPAYYHVPLKQSPGQVAATAGDPAELDKSTVVAMRGPLTYENDSLYGESLATKVREWLELITDVDVHQKRHYADSHLPTGFLHFLGALDDDDLNEIEQDIIEVAGDPQELVTTTSEEEAKWIPVGGDKVADLDAIEQSRWYFKLVLAAAGLTQGEIGIVEGTGFAKELDTQVQQAFKKVAKPYKEAIFKPQNNQALPQILDGFSADVGDVDLRIDLERFDPLQEQVERDQTLAEWSKGVVSLNEVRGELGRDAVEFPYEVEGVDGEPVDLAELPKRLVDLLLKQDRPEVSVDGDDDAGGDGDGGM